MLVPISCIFSIEFALSFNPICYQKCTTDEIKINSFDINKLNPSSLYKSISYVHQNTFIFHDTFRNNITLYNEFTEEKVLNAIKLAGLENVIKRLEFGLDTFVGENGSLLSGGERQRIGIARAIICILCFRANDMKESTKLFIELTQGAYRKVKGLAL